LPPERLRFRAVLQPQKSQYGDLIAGWNLGQRTQSFHAFKGSAPRSTSWNPTFFEELDDVGKGEHGLEFISLGLLDERFHQFAAGTLRLGRW